jgi:hypothetical protein
MKIQIWSTELKTESHVLLVRYIIDSLKGFRAHSYEKAFLFGCIEPDYNILTYLKGSVKIQLLRGHNFKNSEKCMLRIIERLQLRKLWGMQEYYRFGKLIHYISDAFTYPHNETYSKSIREHRNYEKMLNCYFKNYITIPKSMPIESFGKSVVDAINLIHQEYLEAPTSI